MVVAEQRVCSRPESIPGVRIVILWIEILCWSFFPIFERRRKSWLRACRFGEQENPCCRYRKFDPNDRTDGIGYVGAAWVLRARFPAADRENHEGCPDGYVIEL